MLNKTSSTMELWKARGKKPNEWLNMTLAKSLECWKIDQPNEEMQRTRYGGIQAWSFHVLRTHHPPDTLMFDYQECSPKLQCLELYHGFITQTWVNHYPHNNSISSLPPGPRGGAAVTGSKPNPLIMLFRHGHTPPWNYPGAQHETP